MIALDFNENHANFYFFIDFQTILKHLANAVFAPFLNKSNDLGSIRKRQEEGQEGGRDYQVTLEWP